MKCLPHESPIPTERAAAEIRSMILKLANDQTNPAARKWYHDAAAELAGDKWKAVRANPKRAGHLCQIAMLVKTPPDTLDQDMIFQLAWENCQKKVGAVLASYYRDTRPEYTQKVAAAAYAIAELEQLTIKKETK